uniref:Putative secreted protein n=1 Tax=Anopheles darlingi TaxID=43151 RepID=A0A2M4D8Q9_ANODA
MGANVLYNALLLLCELFPSSNRATSAPMCSKLTSIAPQCSSRASWLASLVRRKQQTQGALSDATAACFEGRTRDGWLWHVRCKRMSAPLQIVITPYRAPHSVAVSSYFSGFFYFYFFLNSKTTISIYAPKAIGTAAFDWKGLRGRRPRGYEECANERKHVTDPCHHLPPFVALASR